MITFSATNPSWSLSVEVDDNSYRRCEIMGDNLLELHFSLDYYAKLPRRCICVYDGKTYRLFTTPQVTEVNESQYDYVVMMHSQYYRLNEVMFRNLIDGRLSFTLTAKAHEHLQAVIDVLNVEMPDLWVMGDCIEDTDEVMVSYDYNNCYEALSAIADAFNTEFFVQGTEIHLINVEFNKDHPLLMSYGKEGGFLSGVKRVYDSEKRVLGRVYVQGSDRNIPPGSYAKEDPPHERPASKTLLLPKNGEIYYDGSAFYNDNPHSQKREHYIVSADRQSVVGYENRNKVGLVEGVYDGTDIYPKYVGTVNEVEVENAEKNWVNIIDDNAPFTDQLSTMTIEGEKPTIIFQSGNLAGREFDISGAGKLNTDISLTVTMASSTQGGTLPQKYQVFNGAYSGKRYVDGRVMVTKTSDVDVKLVIKKTRKNDNVDYYKMALYDHSETYETTEFSWSYFTDGGGMLVREVGDTIWDGKIFDSNLVEEQPRQLGWRLDIVPTQLDEVWMPGGNPDDNYRPATEDYQLNAAYMPAAGDEYVLYHIKLPNSYFRNDSNLSGAEWDLMKSVVKYLYDNSKEIYTFTGNISRVWAKNHWTSDYTQKDGSVIVGGIKQYMNLGYHILYRDDYMVPGGVLLRITAVKSSINHPEEVELTFSNALVKESLGKTIVRNRRNRVSYSFLDRRLTQLKEEASRQTTETNEAIASMQ